MDLMIIKYCKGGTGLDIVRIGMEPDINIYLCIYILTIISSLQMMITDKYLCQSM